MKIRLSNSILSLVLALWGVIFGVLVYLDIDSFSLLTTALGFSFLVFVPGFVLTRLFKINSEYAFGTIAYSVGLSILYVMLLGLFINAFLPKLGIIHPLTFTPIATSITMTLVFPLLWLGFQSGNLQFSLFPNQTNRIVSLSISYIVAPLVLIILAVLGAKQLNHTDSNLFVTLLLLGAVVYAIFVTLRANRVATSITATALSLLSVALLLMTSLRGEVVIGHDIQREFAVFQLTKEYGWWFISLYRDAYNACLSITILPTIFSELLPLQDPFIFKVLFQLLFASVPGILFLLFRKFTIPAVASISTLFFMATPTFFLDMPFLLRQEIAFLFLALMLLVLFADKHLGKKLIWLSIAFGVGMVVSHYSTTYTIVALLLLVVLARPIFTFGAHKLSNWSLLPYSGIAKVSESKPGNTKEVPALLVAMLVLATILWSNTITETSTNSLNRVVSNTFSAIVTSAESDNRSTDLRYSLFLRSEPVPDEERLDDYSEEVRDRAETVAGEADVLFATSTYASYELNVIEPPAADSVFSGILPQTTSDVLRKSNDAAKGLFARTIQLLIIFGFFGVLLSRRFLNKPLSTDVMLFAAGNFLLVAAIVVLPVLSVEYGVLRAFQQSLMILGLFATLGILTLCEPISKRVATMVGSGFVALYLIFSTGLAGVLLGTSNPQLHLYNQGGYYEQYYLRATEVSGLTWLAETVEETGGMIQSEAQIDPRVFTDLIEITDANPLNSIHPSLIRKDTYVYLDYENVVKGQAIIRHQDALVRYEYPLEFLDQNKTRVYDNSGVRIYR